MEVATTSVPAVDTTAAPTRLVARQVSQFLLARSRRWAATTGLDALSAFIFEVVLGATMQHHPYRASDGTWMPIQMGATMGRPVSRTAVAESMGIPLTTVSRRALELTAAGLLERRAGALKITQGFFVDPRLEAFVRVDVAEFARMLDALACASYGPARNWSGAALASVPAGIVERSLLGFALRVKETFSVQHGGFVASGIVATINVANVRAITDDPAMAGRYADGDAAVPDDMRVPLSVRTLAQQMELPFETVRRHVAALERAGTLVRKNDGVIVPGDVLRDPAHLAYIHRITAYLGQMLSTLGGAASNQVHPRTNSCR